MTKIRETKVHGAYVVCVPPSVRVALDLELGDYVEWHLISTVELKKDMKNPMVVVLKKKRESSHD